MGKQNEGSISRRTMMGALAGGGWALGSAAFGTMRKEKSAMAQVAYVGCRTSRDRNARGNGIGVWHIASDGRWALVQTVDKLFNPSFLAFDRTKRFLYAVHGDSDEASAFAIDSVSGRLHFLNTVKTGGWNPVHLMSDLNSRFMIVANHVAKGGQASGIASLPIDIDGRFGAPRDVVAFGGITGPHRVEQPFPKPHQVEFDRAGRFIAVPDKGCDTVRIFTIDESGRFANVSTTTARETSGPRHIAFHPSNRFAYVVNELDSTVVSYRFNPVTGALSPFQNQLCIPAHFTANSRAAEIVASFDGRFVYASARGADEVGVFAVDPVGGELSLRGWISAFGKTPRFIALSVDGSRLFVANEESDTIVQYVLDATTGLASSPVIVAETGSPTCIVFA